MIEIQKSVFGYPGVPLFTSFDLTVMDREVVAVVGRSGVTRWRIAGFRLAGKTCVAYFAKFPAIALADGIAKPGTFSPPEGGGWG